MNDKCSGYENMFLFLNDKDFAEHLKQCPECMQEHQKMQKVSELLNEVKPYFKLKKKRTKKILAICATFCLILFSTSLCYVYNDTDLTETLMYGDTLSAEDLDFPVDSYGLLMVDE